MGTSVDGIDWSAPRLVCIAGGFTRYDEHAVQQMNRNIELFRYLRFGDELLLLELVNAVRNAVTIPVIASSGAGCAAHFSEVFKATDVEAALAAGIFHREEVPIQEVKNHLADQGIEVRR